MQIRENNHIPIECVKIGDAQRKWVPRGWVWKTIRFEENIDQNVSIYGLKDKRQLQKFEQV